MLECVVGGDRLGGGYLLAALLSRVALEPLHIYVKQLFFD